MRRGDGWWLRLAGEPDGAVRPRPSTTPPPAPRSSPATASSARSWPPRRPLGIEALPAAEAEPLLAAYHEGVAALAGCFGAWAAVGLDEPDPGALALRLDAGFAGACVPAGALTGPAGYDRLGPLLETLERRDAPLFLHPGPPPRPRRRPGWWAALTDYVAGDAGGVARFSRLGPARASARCACASRCSPAWRPLHRERLTARGGRAAVDPVVFLDTSSYGTRAVDAVLREVGVDQLVHGSDRPVAAPRRTTARSRGAGRRSGERNPARLLGDPRRRGAA